MRDEMPKPFAHASHGTIKKYERQLALLEYGQAVVSSTVGCSIAIVLTHLMGVI